MCVSNFIILTFLANSAHRANRQQREKMDVMVVNMCYMCVRVGTKNILARNGPEIG